MCWNISRRRNGNGQPCHQWMQYAVCGKHEILQKICRNQRHPEEWRVTPLAVSTAERKERCMSTNQYQEMRNRQQAEINAFPMFFAFNKQQFAEGMRTLGLSLSDTCQMCSIFGGGYCRKSDAAKLDEMLTRHRKELEDAISSDKTGKGFIFDMFLQELENHEYSYTGDVQEALGCFGYYAPVYGGYAAADDRPLSGLQ
ncbi:MAG: hypothetical protein ACLVD8_25880 [Enterocloster sp.]|uniref:DUF7659 family protein n=1 Tax=Enterocloster sp. TaxID=2719315 RepID=UPI00399B3F06